MSKPEREKEEKSPRVDRKHEIQSNASGHLRVGASLLASMAQLEVSLTDLTKVDLRHRRALGGALAMAMHDMITAEHHAWAKRIALPDAFASALTLPAEQLLVAEALLGPAPMFHPDGWRLPDQVSYAREQWLRHKDAAKRSEDPALSCDKDLAADWSALTQASRECPFSSELGSKELRWRAIVALMVRLI